MNRPSALARVVAHLVATNPRCAEHLARGFVHLRLQIVLGQKKPAIDQTRELGAALDGESVGREMIRGQRDRFGQLRLPVGKNHSLRAKDQINREALESRGARDLHGTNRLLRVVLATERAQEAIVE